MTDSFWQSTLIWLREFWHFLPVLLPRWLGAWLFCLLFLVFVFRALQPRLRSHIHRFDEQMNIFARRLRYKLLQADAVLEPNTAPAERVLLTWFFRFWTNFASAPSLSVIAIFFAVWVFHEKMQTTFQYFFDPTSDFFRNPWLLPALCYFGSMALSYVTKRVFRRPRPERKHGAFGHRLRDGSFPSGHSLTAFCFWMMCVAALALSGASIVNILLFAVVAVTIVLLTGLSRIYMAVHWPSDVAGGYVIGAVWTIVCFFALRGVL